YRPLNDHGHRSSILDKIKIYDELGFELNEKGDFKEIIRNAINQDHSAVLGLNIEGQIIPFRSWLSVDELTQYQVYMQKFLSYPTDLRGRPRSVESFFNMESNRGLSWVRFKYDFENAIQFLIKRAKVNSVSAIFKPLPVIVAMALYAHGCEFAG